MFSWYRVSVSITPPAKAIMPSISSSKLASGVPMTIPSEANGKAPLNRLSNAVMSGCMSMRARFFLRCAALIDRSCAW